MVRLGPNVDFSCPYVILLIKPVGNNRPINVVFSNIF